MLLKQKLCGVFTVTQLSVKKKFAKFSDVLIGVRWRTEILIGSGKVGKRFVSIKIP